MARMREARFKKCRRLGLNVVGHPKAMNRAGNGQARDAGKISPYGLQLLEKQRLRAYYEVLEKQFVRYVKDAFRSKESTYDALVERLECRLDNLVYRSGFGNSLRQSRQMVVHGHVLVNGKKVNKPSYKVNVNDVISLKEKSQSIGRFKDNFAEMHKTPLAYLETDPNSFSSKLVSVPKVDEVPIEIKGHLVVEFYSRLN